MQKIFTITTIITLTTIALIYISAIKETTKLNLKSSFKSFASNEPWDDYDFYIFAVQWGANYCQVSSDKDTCFNALKKIPLFTVSIHGLWPSMQDGSRIKDCNSGSYIEIVDDGKDPFPKMEKFWPTLSANGNEYFWKHEYNKHGYCYNKREDFDVEEYKKYFSKAIEVYEKFNLGDIIKNVVGEVPTETKTITVSYDELYNGIRNQLGGDYFGLTCKSGYLQEIRIGFNLDFELDEGTFSKSCSGNIKLYFYKY